MTDRYNFLTVALESDVRSEDAEDIITAIRQLRGVADVKPNVRDGNSFTAETRVRADLTEKLWAVLHPKTKGV